MKTFNYIILLCTVFLISCDQEEFLTKTNKNGLNSETFMQTESQAVQAVNAIYDPLNHKGLYKYGFMVMGEGPTDNVINPFADGRTGPDVKALHEYIWNDTNQFLTASLALPHRMSLDLQTLNTQEHRLQSI